MSRKLIFLHVLIIRKFIFHVLGSVENLVICYTAASSGFGGDGVSEKRRNAIIAGNGRVLKAYTFIAWLYLFKKYNNCKIKINM